MIDYSQYSEVIKPFWAPPEWLLSPIWLPLYAIMVVSFGAVFYKVYKGKLSYKVSIPFALNIIFHIAFVNIQFGLKNNLLAIISLLLVLGTIIWMIYAIWPKIRWIAYAQVPYLLWIIYAAALKLSITYLNW